MAAFPITPRPFETDFNLVPNTLAHASPLNKATQTLELPGALWTATLIYSAIKGADRRALRAFLRDLMGMAGRFDLWDHSHDTPDGIYDSGLDTPLVFGASQTGKSLITDGWRATQTGLLVADDYFEVTWGGQKHLHQATSSVDSNGSGVATIAFTPPITAAPADNAPLNLTRASAVFMLTSDDAARWHQTGNRSSLTIDCIEAF